MASSETSIRIVGVEPWEPPEDEPGRGILLRTTRGDVNIIVHNNQERRTTKGIIWVWGARGGFAGPAGGLYRDVAEDLKDEITSVRIDYRMPNNVQECVMDALVGVSFLTGTGHTEIALVGHSFGGAVVITAAPYSEDVKAVAALSSQTFGARGADKVSPRPLLLAHGESDTRLPPYCSEQIYSWAKQPKELVLYPGAEHGLMECAGELREMLADWLRSNLGL